MQYVQHPISRRSRTRRLISTLSLLVTLFAVNALRAQNPAYSFASGIGSTQHDRSNDIVTDADGNLYVTGLFRGIVDFDPGTGTANLICSGAAGTVDGDIFVASYDASGSYRWAFRIGAGGENEGMAIALDGSRNVVVTGYFMGTADFNPGAGIANLSSPSRGAFLAKYTATGTYLWAFQIGPAAWPNDLAIDASGNIVVVGMFSGTVDFNPGSGKATLKSSGAQYWDLFVARYSASGSYLWAFRAGNTTHDGANSIGLDASGNVYVTGVFSGTVDFNPGNGTANLTTGGAFVAKYSSTGAYLWAFRLGNSSGGGEGTEIAVDANGNVAVAGGFSGTVDFDPGAGTANLTGGATNGTDIFIARYTSSGSYQGAFTPGKGSAYGMSVDGNNDIYVTGQIVGANDFDPGSGTAALTTAQVVTGGPYIAGFAARYSPSGVYQWAFSCPGAVISRGVALNGSGDIYLTGSFSFAADFDPSETTAGLTSAGGNDIFIAKYTDAPPLKQVMHQNGETIAMTAVPNPFTSAFTFRYDGPSSPARIEVVDMMGRTVETRDVDGTTEIMLGAELPAGAYIVRTTQGETRRQVMVRKVK